MRSGRNSDGEKKTPPKTTTRLGRLLQSTNLPGYPKHSEGGKKVDIAQSKKTGIDRSKRFISPSATKKLKNK